MLFALFLARRLFATEFLVPELDKTPPKPAGFRDRRMGLGGWNVLRRLRSVWEALSASL